MTAPARSLGRAYAPSRRDLRLLERDTAVAAPVRRPAFGAWLLFAVVVVGAFFVLISSRIALDRTAFELDALEQQIAAEESRYWQLRLQVTELQAPDRIRTLAEEMGMVYPATVETIEVPALGTPVRDVEERWAELKALLGLQP
ncbi:MAG: hypothetical protein R3290_03800 [Acidimicrobiia bacterium]|nr:hypothetical protein [Acidimicrobiia bacterium]